MKRKKIGIIVFILICGCTPFESKDSDMAHYKIIKIKNMEFDWYTRSTAFAETPDFLTVKKENDIDTICAATNLIDFNVVNDTVVLLFIGVPKKYNDRISVPSKVIGLMIKVDTTGKIPQKFIHRETFVEMEQCE